MSNIEQNIKSVFNHIHNNAEISWEEVETTQYIKKILEENNCTVNTFENSTGVIGKFGNFNSNLPVLGIRADIDALWQEVNGEFQANHSCGHDAHISMVLGVLWKLNAFPNIQNKVAIKFIFQPAEEVGQGALKMVENHVIDDVDFLFGIHLRPMEELKNGFASPVIQHGATHSIKFKIIGDDAHGARPHLNKSAIDIGNEIINLINNIRIDPRIPHSAKVTRFIAGGQNANIIPGSGSFSIDVRAQTNEMMDKLMAEINNIIDYIQQLHDISIHFESEDYIPAAVTNELAINIASQAISSTLGPDKLVRNLMTPGGDDFHYYAIKKPELNATMIGLGCDLMPGLHHPNMTFNNSALIKGTEILKNCITNLYNL